MTICIAGCPLPLKRVNNRMKILKYILGSLFLTFAASVADFSQCPTVMPSGTFCITQAEANTAVTNARTVIAQSSEIVGLKDELKQKDVTIDNLKLTNQKNVADLTAQNTKLVTDLGTATGQLIEARATITTYNAMMQFMLEHGRKKCGILSLCIQ